MQPENEIFPIGRRDPELGGHSVLALLAGRFEGKKTGHGFNPLWD